MKNILFYISIFLISIVVHLIITVFVPPIRAMCDCLFNTIQDALVIAGAPIASIVLILYVSRQVKKGMSDAKAFFLGLLFTSFALALLGILNLILFAN